MPLHQMLHEASDWFSLHQVEPWPKAHPGANPPEKKTTVTIGAVARHFAGMLLAPAVRKGAILPSCRPQLVYLQHPELLHFFLTSTPLKDEPRTNPERRKFGPPTPLPSSGGSTSGSGSGQSRRGSQRVWWLTGILHSQLKGRQ